MKATKGTIVRAILLLCVVLNQVLKATGKNPIPIEEGTIASAVEVVLEITIVVVSYWKNNSWSEKAILADGLLKSLKEGEEANG